MLGDTGDISPLMVEQQSGGLNQALDEQDFLFGGMAPFQTVPHRFPCFMGVPETAIVEQVAPFLKEGMFFLAQRPCEGWRHGSRWRFLFETLRSVLGHRSTCLAAPCAMKNRGMRTTNRRTLQEGVRQKNGVGCERVVELEHGDLLEERRGGVDVLRVMVRNLAAHEQSGAVEIRTQSGHAKRHGWLLFRLGHPVMAFHEGDRFTVGLDALMAIEDDALNVDNEVRLYELTMNALRSAMTAHPESVLHLEHQRPEVEGSTWWSSVRLPATSWRRAARLEDIEAMALSSEHRRRASSDAVTESLSPGGVYLLDSPDPHPLIHLAVEMAERGVPMLGLFGLPHASTDITRRLPRPQCYALLSPHGGYEVLEDRNALLATVNAFQWGNERSVLLIDGLDRLGNTFGDDVMLNLFRSLCDGARFNDHVVLCSTDLEMFDTPIRHGLLSEVTVLRQAMLDAWLDEPDLLWDEPFLLAPDEEEEQWLAAQIQHQGAKLGAPSSVFDPAVEGGSVVVDDDTMAEVTAALADVVDGWGATDGPAPTGEPPLPPSSTAVGATPWRPATESDFNEGRFITQSPRFKAEVEETAQPTPRLRQAAGEAAPPKTPPQLRTPQRLPSRKPSPALPTAGPGDQLRQTSALARSSASLPAWPEQLRSRDAFRRENMDVFSKRQSEASERQGSRPLPRQLQGLSDVVAASPDVDPKAFGTVSRFQTVSLPSSNLSEPLSNSLVPVDRDALKPARESASLEQKTLDMDAVYAAWAAYKDEDMESSALYDENGEALKRYKGDAA